MIEIKEVKTKKQIKQFIEFPLKLYKGNPYFVPPLYSDEKKLFRSDYVYYDQAKAVYYNAYDNGKMVGRISGILQLAANEKWNRKRVRFTRFDSIDDQSVADALFDAVEKWAIEKGMNEVVGPLGFSDLEREGLLIEGFDELSTFEEQYNYPYYQKLIEARGYEKEVDWVERQIRAPEHFDERISRINEMMMKKYKLHLCNVKNTKEFLNKYGDAAFDILDKTYDKLYGTVPFTEKTKKMTLDNFKLLIDPRFVSVILDENERVVCFGLCMPSIAKAMQKSGGRLTPAAIVKVLKSIKKPEIIDLALVGILPEYEGKGIVTTFFVALNDMLRQDGVKYAETNLNLEDNLSIQNQWKIFDARLHKRRRCFVKKIQSNDK